MRFLIRAFATVAIVAVTAVAALLVAIQFVNWEKYKAEISERVTTLTNRTFRIEGELVLKLWPTPRLVAGEVSLGSPDTGFEEDFFSAKRVAVSVKPLPLLEGRIVAQSVNIESPELRYRVNAKGDRNWRFRPQREREKQPKRGLGVLIERVDVLNARIDYRSDITGSHRHVDFPLLSAWVDPSGRVINGRLTGRFRNTDFEARGKVGSVEQFLQGHLGPARLTVNAGQLNGTVAGGIDDLLGERRFRLSLDAQSPDLEVPGALLGIDLRRFDASVTAKGMLIGVPAHFTLEQLVVALRHENAELLANGEVNDAFRENFVVMRLAAEGVPVQDTLAAFGLDGSSFSGNLDVQGGFIGQPKSGFRLEALGLDLISEMGELRADGDVNNLGRENRLQLALSGRSANVPGLLRRLGFDTNEVGQLEASADLAGTLRDPSLEGLRLDIMLDGIQAKASGRIEKLLASPRLNLDADIEAADLVAASRMLELNLPNPTAVSANVRTRIQGTIENLELTGVEGRFAGDGIEIETYGDASIAGERPDFSIQASAKVDSLARFNSLFPSALPATPPVDLSLAELRSGADGKLSIELKAASDDTRLALSGEIGRLAIDTPFDLRVLAAADSAIGFWRLLGLDVSLPGDFSYQGGLSREASDADALIFDGAMRSGEIEADAAGMVSLAGPREAKVSLKLKAPSTSSFRWALPENIADAGPVLFDGQVFLGSQIRLQAFDLNLGENHLGGELTVIPGAARSGVDKPLVLGNLRSHRLDFDALFDRNEGPHAADVNEFVFSPQPFAVSWMKQTDAQIELRAERLHYRGFNLSDAVIGISAAKEFLRVDRFKAAFAGGELTADLLLDLRAQPARAALYFAIDGLDPGQLQTFERGDTVYFGDIDLELRVEGAGQSLRELMSNANGYALISIDSALLPRSGLHLFATDVIVQTWRAINPFAEGREFYEIDCGVVGFRIDGGVARSDGTVAIQSEELTLMGSGQLDLSDESLTFFVRPKAREGFGLAAGTLANVYRVGGTLMRPRVVPDPGGMLRSGASMGAAILTSGMSILLQGLLDRVTSSQQVCESTRERFQENQYVPYTPPSEPQFQTDRANER